MANLAQSNPHFAANASSKRVLYGVQGYGWAKLEKLKAQEHTYSPAVWQIMNVRVGYFKVQFHETHVALVLEPWSLQMFTNGAADVEEARIKIFGSLPKGLRRFVTDEDARLIKRTVVAQHHCPKRSDWKEHLGCTLMPVFDRLNARIIGMNTQGQLAFVQVTCPRSRYTAAELCASIDDLHGLTQAFLESCGTSARDYAGKAGSLLPMPCMQWCPPPP